MSRRELIKVRTVLEKKLQHQHRQVMSHKNHLASWFKQHAWLCVSTVVSVFFIGWKLKGPQRVSAVLLFLFRYVPLYLPRYLKLFDMR